VAELSWPPPPSPFLSPSVSLVLPSATGQQPSTCWGRSGSRSGHGACGLAQQEGDTLETAHVFLHGETPGGVAVGDRVAGQCIYVKSVDGSVQTSPAPTSPAMHPPEDLGRLGYPILQMGEVRPGAAPGSKPGSTCFCFVFWVSGPGSWLCSPDHPGACDPPASVSRGLGVLFLILFFLMLRMNPGPHPCLASACH
jgi:hypothetical protein